jgi:hypothetical protein
MDRHMSDMIMGGGVDILDPHVNQSELLTGSVSLVLGENPD